ncbi:unnamed protein product [Ilex paraguariensis]|uniref:Carbohydrate kinase PfkB domain-containing protein n=1 Tax=Ilex paraguariensis TaxID=185542 RepID=A0ABC8QY18_9AQUA
MRICTLQIVYLCLMEIRLPPPSTPAPPIDQGNGGLKNTTKIAVITVSTAAALNYSGTELKAYRFSTARSLANSMAGRTPSGDPEDLSLDTNGGSHENGKLVVCFGEMLIDFVLTVGGVSLAEAPAFKKAPGGAPANVAVCISRLGGSSAFIGKVGEDDFGCMLADILK